jgi:ABC-2 type transport system permease protein
VRLYAEVARCSFRRHLTYRAATLAGLFTNAVFGVLIAAVFSALYRDRGGDVAGFSLREALTFVWASQSLLAVAAIWGWWEIATAIKSGDVVADLMKPFSFQGYWLSRDLGRAACQFLTRMLPTFLVGVIFYDLALPRSAGTWLAVAPSVLLAVVVSFGWRFILNLTAFWLLDSRGLNSISILVINFFSGFLVPLSFFPPELRAVADLLPFRAMVMLPIEILLDQRDSASALAIQLFWAVALVLLAQAVLAVAVRKLVIQGG